MKLIAQLALRRGEVRVLLCPRMEPPPNKAGAGVMAAWLLLVWGVYKSRTTRDAAPVG